MNTLKLQGVREEALPKMYQRVYQHMTAISEHFSGRKTEMISDHLHEIIAVRLRPNKKVQNLNRMWYKSFAQHIATQGDFGLESP